jgi:hypothetical protein
MDIDMDIGIDMSMDIFERKTVDIRYLADCCDNGLIDIEYVPGYTIVDIVCTV